MSISIALSAILTLTPGCAPAGAHDENAPSELRNVTVLGEPGRYNGQFVYPRGLDVFENGTVTYAVIVDKTARIQVMDLDTGRVIGAINTPKWDRGMPTGLTVQSSVLDPAKLAIYVADTHEHRVLMYELPIASTDKPVPTEPDLQFGSFGQGPGQFIYPTDIAVEVDNSGVVTHIYVSEYGGNDRINRFRVDHTTTPPAIVWESQIGIVGQEVDASDDPLALARPQSIELWTDPQGRREIVVTDASHHRVGRITTDGELIAWYGDPLDTSPEAYRFPYGLTILDDGTALIAEFGGNTIRRIELETGKTLFRTGVPGRSVGQLAQPWSVGVMGGRLVVLDSGNSRIEISDPPPGAARMGREYTQPRTHAPVIGSSAP